MVISMWSRSASQGVSFQPQPLTAPCQGISFAELLTKVINIMKDEGILTNVREPIIYNVFVMINFNYYETHLK